MSTNMPERIPGGGVDLSHLARNAQATQQSGSTQAPGGTAHGAPGAPGGASQVVDVPSLVIDVTEQVFEQVASLSTVVPVLFLLGAASCEQTASLAPTLERLTREFDGRLLLARVDVDASPGLAQAFQVQGTPTVIALVSGRPVPLFQGPAGEGEVRDLLTQLVQLAEQNGVSGRVNAPADADGADGAAAAPAEPQIPEAHLPAVEAAERGDYETSVREWEAVLQKSPADAQAKAALAQMKLLHRLQGHTTQGIREAAAANPRDLEAQMRVADLDLSGGHVEDAFLRLLDLFAASSDDERSEIRERLLELFEVVGVADPRVIAARGRLANLLY